MALGRKRRAAIPSAAMITMGGITNVSQKCIRKLQVEDWERIIDTLQDGVYITSADGLTLKVNAAYEQIAGVPAGQLEGRYMSDIVREGLLSTSITQRVIDERKKISAEQVTKNGKHLVLQGVPISDQGGKISFVVTYVRDTTVISHLQEELDRNQETVAQYKSRLSELEGHRNFVAESSEFRATITLADKAAKVDSTVLILGESGTGKEVIAREIHEMSNRKNHPFLKVNCGAIPEALLESELFGYESGAFTGARKGGYTGLFETASKGTLFLDEIGDMPLHLQVKLLRVLQERTITKIGSTRAVPVNTRVIAATNRDLEQMVRESKFREDLFYRLNIVVIRTPPLRDRKRDIPGLIDFFVHKLNTKYHISKQLAPDLIAALLEYDWPGNVRELENITERLLVTSNADIISVEDAKLPYKMVGPMHTSAEVEKPFEEVPLKVAVERLERQMLADAAKRYETTYQIAEALQISQPSVSRKLKKYQIVSKDVHNLHK